MICERPFSFSSRHLRRQAGQVGQMGHELAGFATPLSEFVLRHFDALARGRFQLVVTVGDPLKQFDDSLMGSLANGFS